MKSFKEFINESFHKKTYIPWKQSSVAVYKNPDKHEMKDMGESMRFIAHGKDMYAWHGGEAQHSDMYRNLAIPHDNSMYGIARHHTKQFEMYTHDDNLATDHEYLKTDHFKQHFSKYKNNWDKKFDEDVELTEMAKRSRTVAQRILKRLKPHLELGGGDKNQIQNIVPHEYHSRYVAPDGKKLGDRYNNEWYHIEQHGTMKRIPVSSIISRQHSLDAGIVAKKIQGKYPDHDPSVPYALHHEGKHYLIDGNHRIAKARLLGQTHVWAKVADARPFGDEEYGVQKTYKGSLSHFIKI